MNHSRLRQIAILVDSLDTASADRLLDQLPEELQQRVRNAVMDLDAVSDAERHIVMTEFHRGAAGKQASSSERHESAAPRPSVPSTYQPAWRQSMVGTATNFQTTPLTATGPESSESSPPTRPEPTAAVHVAPAVERSSDLSEMLTAIDVETLASVVLRESPQVLAAVLSLLPPLRSAQLLEYCPPDLQSSALERLHHLEELDDDMVHLLQQELHLVIRQRIKLKQQQRVGRHALAEIMVAAQQLRSSQVSQVVRQQLQGQPLPLRHSSEQLDRLRPNPVVTPASHDRLAVSTVGVGADLPEKRRTSEEPLTDRLVSNELEQTDALADFDARMNFAELVECDTASLQSLLATAKPQLTLLALRGASQSLLDRVLQMLPRNEAKEVQFRVQNLGPTRIHDIRQAQEYLMRLASLLEDMGRFRRPKGRSRSAA